MSTGTKSGYWDGQELPAVYKHELIRRYLPVFLNKTGSLTGRVVYVDGYAGRGTYDDGSPGSPLLILEHALHARGLARPIDYEIHFFEADARSFRALEGTVAPFVEQGVRATASRAEVLDGLGGVLSSARGVPLFAFLDPCGVGIPYPDLVAITQRSGARGWPPTECLVNFSMEALRRIGGHLTSSKRDDRSVARLDQALGGTWWHPVLLSGRPKAQEDVVQAFVKRLASDTGMRVTAVPVRRAPGHKPVYYLIHLTRHSAGQWHFVDCAAKASEQWWLGFDDQVTGDQLSLFSPSEAVRPRTYEHSERVTAEIAQNIERLVRHRGEFVVRDHIGAVLGPHLGQVPVKHVKAALALLAKNGVVVTESRGRDGQVWVRPAGLPGTAPTAARPGSVRRPSVSARPTA